jgi:putative ABC transport system permease protein
MIKDYVLFSFNNLKKRRLRSWLTMIGIFIGIAAVVSIISLGYGMQHAINEEFQRIGSDRIIISPGGIFFGPMTDVSAAELTEDDLDFIKKVKGIKVANSVLSELSDVEYKDETEYVNIFGVPQDKESRKEIEKIGFFSIKEGRHLKGDDKYKAILGYNIAYETFDNDLKLGDKIYIKEKKFDVVGIQNKAGTGIHDIIIRIPMDIARDLFDEPDKISMIFARVDEGLKPGEVAEKVKKELRKFRNVEEGEEDFSVETAEKTISTLTLILQLISVVLIGIAAISLVVGGIGIMNTMYTSVVERTREIGIMKAVGAKNKQILGLFLIESGLLGIAGGVIGIFIGIGLSKLVEFLVIKSGIIFFKSYFSLYMIFAVLLFSFLVGCISGIMPARQASKLKPVDALRY